MEFLRHLFESDFMPHGACYRWDRGIVGLHVVSDTLIALAYYSIPITLVYFVLKRRDLPYAWMFGMFGAFIVACGTTHLVEVWTVWHGTYRFSGVVKALTALLSIATAVLLVKLVPYALALRGPRELEALNRQLSSEIEKRQALDRRLEVMMASAPDGMLLSDAEGNIEYANRQAGALFGYGENELLGMKVEVLIPERFRRHHPEHRGQYMNRPHLRPMGQGLELFGLRKDGTEFPVEISLSPVPLAHGIGVLSAIRDVTERQNSIYRIRQLNETLEQRAQLLTQANAELESFTYAVSHDLRAPVRHVDAYAQLLRDDLAGRLDERSRHYLNQVLDSAKQMGQLIDDLLSFSRASRLEVRKERVDLSELVEDARNRLRLEAGDRDIEWQVDDLPKVEGDMTMLRQVFHNLLSNAIKYSRRRERAQIRVTWRKDAELGVVISVADNGVGFDMKHVNKLFGVFERLHLAEEFEGTGVGLAMVRRIVAKHEGICWAEGKKDEGATFYFSLPG